MTKFICEKCHQTFSKGWSEEEAEKEYDTAPWNIIGDDRALICDDCFEEFKKWFYSLTPEDHERIKNEYSK